MLVDKFHKIEYDVFDVLETYKALKYFFILGVTAFTASVVNSIGIAALFAFNKLKVQTWKEFVCKLGTGLLLVIPLSAMVYYCDWFVYPQMKKEYVRLKLEMTDNVPRDIDNNNTYHVYFNSIKNDMPMLLSKARLTYKLDSLKNAFDAATDTCSMYLSMLPDTMAAEASNKYRLGSMGVELTCASQPTTSKDSLIYIQKYYYTIMQTRHGTRKQRYVNSPMNTASGRATQYVCIFPISSAHLSFSCCDAITR